MFRWRLHNMLKMASCKVRLLIFLSLLLVCCTHGFTQPHLFDSRQGCYGTVPLSANNDDNNIEPTATTTTTTTQSSGKIDEEHAAFMEMALKQARKAGSRGEVPIGAVIVERTPDGKCRVLSQACNMVETRHDASAHAELLALRQAGRKAKNWRLPNATLYTTLEPCPMCLTAAQGFRVSSIVYGAPDLRLGAIETHLRLLDVTHPFHTIGEVVPGICSDESANLLKDFFRKRRKESKKVPPKKGRSGRIGMIIGRIKRFFA